MQTTTKWQLAGVVFDIQLIPAAKKAVKERKQIKGLYTFGDPQRIAVKDSACKVECTTTDKRIGYVVAIYSATTEQVIKFKKMIGYDHLGIIIEKV